MRKTLTLHFSSQDIEHLYQESAWKLDKKFGGPSKSYDAFRLAITENPAIWDEIDLEPKLKETLMDNISRRLTPQPIKLRSGTANFAVIFG